MNESHIIQMDTKTDHGGITKSYLDLEQIDVNLYRSISLFRPALARNVFGGQVVAQALAAALKTLPRDYQTHSLHSYFLRGGDVDVPIVYDVEHAREGNTYRNRSVKAFQNETLIFTMQASFKKEESDQLEYQMTMPDVPGPEGLLNTHQIMQNTLQSANINQDKQDAINKYLKQQNMLETRPVNKELFTMEKSFAPNQFSWVKTIEQIDGDVQFNQCVAAYISDTVILRSALLPAAVNDAKSPKKFMITSLDHSVWFHNPVQTGEWLLYETESPFCGDGRALVHGRLWRRDGVLAMSVTQEGVIRRYKSKL